VTAATSVFDRPFRSERAVSPVDGSTAWVVVNDSYELHPEAVEYLAGLRRDDDSVNTERVYASRVALYLSYCAAFGVVWRAPTLWQMAAFLRWLTEEPLPPKGRKARVEPRFRKRGTANAIMTTTCEFLRFCVPFGWVDQAVVDQLVEPRYLRHLPAGYDAGEDGQHRTVRAKLIKYRVAVEGYEWLTSEQIEALLGCTVHARDRFLVALLAATGTRIGEALGLRREDMHLLSNSGSLGCRVAGPHIHVRRRQNANGALAKARVPRWIPVTEDVVGLYAEYQYERDQVAAAADCDMVFVNLFRAPLGTAMKYPNAKDLFDRLAKRAGLTARPHMLRHSAATRWIRGGVDPDVVQNMLGHASPQSMTPYLHATDQDKREAVEKVAALQRGQK